MGKFKRNLKLEERIDKLVEGFKTDSSGRIFSPVSSFEFARSTKSSVTSHECDEEVKEICAEGEQGVCSLRREREREKEKMMWIRKGGREEIEILNKWLIKSHINYLNL